MHIFHKDEEKMDKLHHLYLELLKKAKEIKTKYDKILDKDLLNDKEYSKFKVYEYMPLNSKNILI